MNKNRLIRKLLRHENKSTKQNTEQLYIKYIDALVKSENLQNKLEKLCTSLMDTPNHSTRKRANYVNNNLNNVLVEVMLMQNLLNYISLK